MDFLEKLGTTITEKGKEVGEKAKDFTEITKLKSQIRTSEEVIKKLYLEIGQQYCEEHANDANDPYKDKLDTIANAKRAIADLEMSIKEIKEPQI